MRTRQAVAWGLGALITICSGYVCQKESASGVLFGFGVTFLFATVLEAAGLTDALRGKIAEIKKSGEDFDL